MTPSSVEYDDPAKEYAKVGRTLDALLLEGKYPVLDASVARLQSTGRSLSDGRWSHDAAVEFLGHVDVESQRGVFSDLMQFLRLSKADVPWQARLETLRAWRDASPKSVAASVCISNFYLHSAWDARGSTWAHEVSDAAWKKFFSRVRFAVDALRAVDVRAEECLAWFPISLLAIKAQERTVGEWYATFERGIKACPTYWNTYTNGADFHLARWSGSREQFADFLRRSVDLSGEYSGKSVAARIVWSLLDHYGENVVDELSEQDWGLIRGGFGDWLQAHPRSSVANYYLIAARCFEDKSTVARLAQTAALKPYGAVWDTHLGEQFGGFRGVCAWAKN